MCHKISDLSRYGHCCVWGKTVGLHDSQVIFPCLKQGEEISIEEELKKRNLSRAPYKDLGTPTPYKF